MRKQYRILLSLLLVLGLGDFVFAQGSANESAHKSIAEEDVPNIDLDDNSCIDGRDLFMFGRIWQRSREDSSGLCPHPDRGNLVEDEYIDDSDLFELMRVFRNKRHAFVPTETPQPTETPTITPTHTEEPTPTHTADLRSINVFLPLEKGRRWSYTSRYGNFDWSIDSRLRSKCGRSLLRETDDIDGSKQYYGFSGDSLSLYAAEGETDLSFCSSPVTVGDDRLSNGRSYSTKVYIEGIQATIVFKYTKVGKVSVPMGTYDNCYKTEFQISAMGESLTLDTWYLAPNVGRIKVGILNQFLEIVDYAELTSTNFLDKPSQKIVDNTLPLSEDLKTSLDLDWVIQRFVERLKQ